MRLWHCIKAGPTGIFYILYSQENSDNIIKKTRKESWARPLAIFDFGVFHMEVLGKIKRLIIYEETEIIKYI